MNRLSVGSLASRGWMVVVTVIVVAAAAAALYRLHGIFGSQGDGAVAAGVSSEIVDFNPKRVVLEVFGAPGAIATINYLDVNAVPQHVDDASLPWTYDTTTTQPTVFAQLVAQGNGSTLGCRITIDGAVKDERTVNTVSAYTFCLDKSG